MGGGGRLGLGVPHVVQKYSVGSSGFPQALQEEEGNDGYGVVSIRAARRACSLRRATITNPMANAIGGTTIVSSSAILKTEIEMLIGPASAVLETVGTPKGGEIFKL